MLRGKAKDYAAPCTSELPAEDFILPLPKDKSPLYQEQEELTKLFNDIIAAQGTTKPLFVDYVVRFHSFCSWKLNSRRTSSYILMHTKLQCKRKPP